MALIVEDGTGLAAESYISVANAITFLAARGKTTFTGLGSDTLREQCLRNTADYMVQRYREAWKGYRSTIVQLLDWPRSYVSLDDFNNFGYGYGEYYLPWNIVPVQIPQAQCLLAEIAAGETAFELAPNLDPIIKREKFDVFETEYADNSPPYVVYRAAAMLLSPFLATSGAGVRLVRT